MRHILIVILLLLFFSCKDLKKKEITIETLQNQKVSFVGDSLSNDRYNDFLYEQVELLSFDLNNDQKLDTIILEKIKDWTDPGDFHCIKVWLNNGKKLKVFNIDGWTTTNLLSEFIPNFSSSRLNSKFVTLKQSSKNNTLLMLKGYHYASQPGYLTVLNIFGNKPYLIFNKKVGIYDFSDYNNDGIIDLATTNVYKQFFEEGKSEVDVYLLNGGVKQETKLVEK